MSCGAGARPQVSPAWDLFATISSPSHFRLCLFMHLVLLILFMRSPDLQGNPACEPSSLTTGGYKALCSEPHGKAATPHKNTYQALVQSQCTAVLWEELQSRTQPPALHASCAPRNRMSSSLTQVPPLKRLYWQPWLRHLHHLLLGDLQPLALLSPAPLHS